MEVWIIYGEKEAEYNKKYIEFYFEEAKILGIEIQLILAEQLQFGVQNNQLFLTYREKGVKMPDVAICRIIYPLLSKHLEWMGVSVYNNSFVAEVCNDKAKTYQYLAGAGIHIVDTCFCKMEFLKKQLYSKAENMVVKSTGGHGGQEVFLWDGGNGSAILENLNNCDTVIQPLAGNRHQDLRVYVIGNNIIAAVLRTAKSGFKSNFSLGGEVCLYELSQEEKSIVEKVIQMFDFGLVGIDFLVGDGGELIFNEIEDVVGARMLYQCTAINLVKLYLEFIMEKHEKGLFFFS